MQLGSQAFTQGQEIVNKNLNRYVNVSELRCYFNVSTSYVLSKLKLLFFPFRHQSWARIVRRAADESAPTVVGYAPAREDLNATDLYIPVMSYVTYVLLYGATLGFNHKFTPDVLGITATSAFITVLFEVFLMKLGMYLLSIQTDVGVLDLLAYFGYQFVAINTLVSVKFFLHFWHWAFLLIAAYILVSYGFFTLRSMRYIFLPDHGTSNAIARDSRKQRVLYLFLFTALQSLSIIVLA